MLEKARLILLPKDYIRLKLTGTVATEPTDANGTMMMDCVSRQWGAQLCRALGWDLDRLPPITDPWAEAGRLRGELARRWGTPAVVTLAAGTGDNMACTIGVGAARHGDVVITIGTSGVVNAVDRVFHPAPESAVLTAPHAAPDTFLSQGVVMSATASLDWLARLTATGAAELAQEAESFADMENIVSAPLMRPSLSGIRTPDNRPDTGGILDGITQLSDRPALAYALLEGVAFQFARCISAQKQAGVAFETLQLVGGGSRSLFWAGLIAAVLEQPLSIPEGAALAANRGAARLARIAAGEVTTAILATRLPAAHTIPVNKAWLGLLHERLARWQSLPLNSAGGITGTTPPA
jgi:xylulokinase